MKKEGSPWQKINTLGRWPVVCWKVGEEKNGGNADEIEGNEREIRNTYFIPFFFTFWRRKRKMGCAIAGRVLFEINMKKNFSYDFFYGKWKKEMANALLNSIFRIAHKL